jgi:hypothetical protein
MRYYYTILRIAFGCFDTRYVTLGGNEKIDVIQFGYRTGCYHDIILGASIILICRFDYALA